MGQAPQVSWYVPEKPPEGLGAGGGGRGLKPRQTGCAMNAFRLRQVFCSIAATGSEAEATAERGEASALNGGTR